MPKIRLPISKEDFDASGSKFITFPAGAKVGDRQYRAIEVGMIDWDNPGQSMKVPIVVLDEGPDKGKEEKLSFGVSKTGIWKGKQLFKNITGQDIGIGKDGTPEIDTDLALGKQAVGVWEMQEGFKGGDASKGKTTYPKLVDILPAGSQPKQPETMM